MAKDYRSAETGRFVDKQDAKASPATTTGETRGGKSTHGAHRSAVTGRFVDKATAKANPKTTIRDS